MSQQVILLGLVPGHAGHTAGRGGSSSRRNSIRDKGVTEQCQVPGIQRKH
jgi:hypothetical protein